MMTKADRFQKMIEMIDHPDMINVDEMEKFLQGIPSRYDSLAQGNTRDDPKTKKDEPEKGTNISEHIEDWVRKQMIGQDYSWDYSLSDLPKDSDSCDHFWYVTGHSPLTNEDYENCKYCDMRREDA